jgi:hypothetical protein
MPWKRICKLPLDPKRKPDQWTGGQVRKLEGTDKRCVVREFMKNHWKKYKSVVKHEPVLEVCHDSAKKVFRLMIAPPDNLEKPALQEMRKLISGFNPKLRKVILDETGAEYLNFKDDGIVRDDDAPREETLQAQKLAAVQTAGSVQDAKKPAYEKLLPTVEAKVGEFGAKYPDKLQGWQEKLEQAQETARAGDYVAGELQLREILTSIVAARAVAKGDDPQQAAQEYERIRLSNDQLNRLRQLDEAIAAKAGVNYQAAAEADDVLFRVELYDAPRPVGLFRPFKASLVMDKVCEPVDIARRVQDEFAQEEKQLRDAILGSTKSAILAQARTKALRIVQQMNKDQQIHLAAKTQDQRMAEVIKALGALNPKDNGASYEKLRPDQRALLDNICSAIEEVLTPVRAEAPQRCREHAEVALAAQMLTLDADSDEMFDLSLKGDADLKADAAIGLGLVDAAVVQQQKAEAAQSGRAEKQLKWYQALSAEQQALVNAAAEGMAGVISGSTPNRYNPDDRSILLGGEQFEFDRQLGEGGKGRIFRLKQPGTAQCVVVKALKDEDERLEMERELRIHREVMRGGGHKNITPFKGVARGPDGKLYMIMDEARGGDLSQMSSALTIAAASGTLPPEAKQVLARQFARDAVAGLKAVQQHNVTHHDIKAKNYLLAADGTMMISDFGSGQIGRDEHGTVVGPRDGSVDIPTTPIFEAPEMDKHNGAMTVTGKADNYTLGLMIRQLTGGKSDGAAASALDKLTAAMLNPDPDQRPTADSLEHSSFLLDADVDDPSKVAVLKSAAVRYAKATAEVLSGVMTEEWLLDNGLSEPRILAQARNSKYEMALDGMLRGDGDGQNGAMTPKELKALQAAIMNKVNADERIQVARDELAQAAGAFSKVKDPIPFPELSQRWSKVVLKMVSMLKLVDGREAHARLSAKMQACQKLIDLRDAKNGEVKVKELEDLLAAWAGNKKLGHAIKHLKICQEELAVARANAAMAHEIPEKETNIAHYEKRIRHILTDSLR